MSTPNPLFVSRQAELIFYLTQMEGKQRNNALRLTDIHFEDVNKANEWLASHRNDIVNGPLNPSEALEKLQEIHSIVVDTTYYDEDC